MKQPRRVHSATVGENSALSRYFFEEGSMLTRAENICVAC
jgi:hypothetical protein